MPDFPATANPNQLNGLQITGFVNSENGPIRFIQAGDVNGDGLADTLIGIPEADAPPGSRAGRIYVIAVTDYGSRPATVEVDRFDAPQNPVDPLLQDFLGFSAFGGGANFTAGVSVATGDVNGDGVVDIVTGASGAGGGSVYVLLGDGTVPAGDVALGGLGGGNGFRIDGQAGFLGGASVAVGDVNGDGFADIITGTPGRDGGAGGASVVFGASGPFNPVIGLDQLDGGNGFSLTGFGAGEGAGSGLASGDFNGDGFDDLIIGAPPTNNFAGGAALIFGQGGPFSPIIDVGALNGTNGFFINGILANDSTGFDVAGGIDINGDGFDDVLIGAPDTDGPSNAFDAGSLFVLFGGPTSPGPSLNLATLDGTNGFRFDTLAGGLRNGVFVGASDLDGDGIDDAFFGDEAGGDGILIYGVAPTEAVVRNGSAADQTIFGGAFGDTLNGESGNDVLNGRGGADQMNGGDGSDAGILDVQGDRFDGGAGVDTAVILGTGAGLRNSPFTVDVVNTEVLLVPHVRDPRFGVPPANYAPYVFELVIPDASVIPGQRLDVIATGLEADEGLAVDASAVAGGRVWIFAGPGANDHDGGAGSDAVLFGAFANFDGSDVFDGGANIDSLGFRGNYVGPNAVVFQDGSFSGVEVIAALSGLETPFGGLIDPNGFDYDFTLANGNVAPGETLDINGTALGTDESLTADGSLVTGGRLRFFGGDGADEFTGGDLADLFYGGLGGDTMDGRGGANVFAYRDVAESTPDDSDLLIWNNGDGSDLVDVSAIDADTTVPGNQAFQIIGGDAFDAAGQLRFQSMNQGEWIVEADINGDGVADFRIVVLAPDLSGGVFVG